jgi:hypothetical protein
LIFLNEIIVGASLPHSFLEKSLRVENEDAPFRTIIANEYIDGIFSAMSGRS